MLQRDSETTKLANSFCVSQSMGAIKVTKSKSDLQGHSRALAMVPLDRSHTIFYAHLFTHLVWPRLQG